MPAPTQSSPGVPATFDCWLRLARQLGQAGHQPGPLSGAEGRIRQAGAPVGLGLDAFPLRVNDDQAGVANDQFNQWLAIDPSDGSVNLSWNDTRNDPAHLSRDIFYARSTGGGPSFCKNVQVTTAPTNETCCGADLGNQYGDYEGIAAMNGSIHPIWTDRRAAVASLDEEIFTATITVK